MGDATRARECHVISGRMLLPQALLRRSVLGEPPEQLPPVREVPEPARIVGDAVDRGPPHVLRVEAGGDNSAQPRRSIDERSSRVW